MRRSCNADLSSPGNISLLEFQKHNIVVLATGQTRLLFHIYLITNHSANKLISLIRFI